MALGPEPRLEPAIRVQGGPRTFWLCLGSFGKTRVDWPKHIFLYIFVPSTILDPIRHDHFKAQGGFGSRPHRVKLDPILCTVELD